MLSAKRVLIITQSRFVREQIAADFSTLRTLKMAAALPADLPGPKLYENKHLISTETQWESLRQYDVVVSTPNGASPAYKGVSNPSADLFDLVLIDEAHHSPAPTWNALIEAFPTARCILFTATPFRHDRKEIGGRYVYNYPIQRAFEDGIYGEMLYESVAPKADESSDVALARGAERVFLNDRASGFHHILMVRAESQARANDLAIIYREHTSLNLELVHSGKSQRATERIIERLRAGDLDGVICVNMLGEGFDLPKLKIAALHAPHRSLAVTMQFFGRFARKQSGLGDATFLAVGTEIDEELGHLFSESEAWGKRIRTIGQERIGKELYTREFLDDFEARPIPSEQVSLQDLSLYSFSLFNHVKVYHVHGQVNLDTSPKVTGTTIEKVWVAPHRSTTTFLVREAIRPKWATSDGVDRVEYHLFVIYYDEDTQLLFICGTDREEFTYKEIGQAFVIGHVQALSLSKINRVLRSFSELELFNVGMRNRATGITAESYRQISGSAAHIAIDKGDAALYHRGHIFGRGRTPTGVTTVGLSSLSKVWRLESTKIPELVKWCQQLARDIANPAPFTTGIALDHLDAGSDIAELPDHVVLAADWHEDIYRKPPLIEFHEGDGVLGSAPLLDFDLKVDIAQSDRTKVVLHVDAEDATTCLVFRVAPYPSIIYLDDSQPRFRVQRGFRTVDLAEFLDGAPLRLHMADGSLVEGSQLFTAPSEDSLYDSAAYMREIDWEAAGTDIFKEFDAVGAEKSIHDWLREELIASPAEIVFYDHRKGECADFLTVSLDTEGTPIISLYHCKGAGGPPSGERVDDLYEVCGQAVKSTQWRNKRRLIRQVQNRHRTGSRFDKGDLAAFMQLIDPHPRYEFPLQIYAVQPGVSKGRIASKLSSLLGTTSRGIVAVGGHPLRVICSS